MIQFQGGKALIPSQFPESPTTTGDANRLRKPKWITCKGIVVVSMVALTLVKSYGQSGYFASSIQELGRSVYLRNPVVPGPTVAFFGPGITNQTSLTESFAYQADRYSHLHEFELSGSLQASAFMGRLEGGFSFSESARQEATTVGFTYLLHKRMEVRHSNGAIKPIYMKDLANCSTISDRLGDAVVSGWSLSAWTQLNLYFHYADNDSGRLRASYSRATFAGKSIGVDLRHAASEFFATRQITEYIASEIQSSDNDGLPPTPSRSVFDNLEAFLAYLDQVRKSASSNNKYVISASYLTPLNALENYPRECFVAQQGLWDYTTFNSVADWARVEFNRIDSMMKGASSWLNSEGLERLGLVRNYLAAFLQELQAKAEDHFRRGADLSIPLKRIDEAKILVAAAPEVIAGALHESVVDPNSFSYLVGAFNLGASAELIDQPIVQVKIIRKDGGSVDEQSQYFTTWDLSTFKTASEMANKIIAEWVPLQRVPSEPGTWGIAANDFKAYLKSVQFDSYFNAIKSKGCRVVLYTITKNGPNRAGGAPNAVVVLDANGALIANADISESKSPLCDMPVLSSGVPAVTAVYWRPVIQIEGAPLSVGRLFRSENVEAGPWREITSVQMTGQTNYITDLSATGTKGFYKIIK